MGFWSVRWVSVWGLSVPINYCTVLCNHGIFPIPANLYKHVRIFNVHVLLNMPCFMQICKLFKKLSEMDEVSELTALARCYQYTVWLFSLKLCWWFMSVLYLYLSWTTSHLHINIDDCILSWEMIWTVSCHVRHCEADFKTASSIRKQTRLIVNYLLVVYIYLFWLDGLVSMSSFLPTRLAINIPLIPNRIQLSCAHIPQLTWSSHWNSHVAGAGRQWHV